MGYRTVNSKHSGEELKRLERINIDNLHKFHRLAEQKKIARKNFKRFK